MTDFPPNTNEQASEKSIFSVSGISKALKDVIEGHFSAIYVRGEVTGLKRHTSGHIYFSLKDADAVMDAICWRGTRNTDHLKEGLEVIAFGKITTYPGRSKYQMIVSAFEATGQGALLQLLQQLKEKLLKEGLFDVQFKKALPIFPKRIGLITSPTGAVLRDILHRLEERYPCHVIFKPALVQGEGAAKQIIEAIRLMNILDGSLRPEVIIIARGGGSLEDLFAFNDEGLVRATFASNIPIISAIGHETDFTLLDFVADKRAPTPTAAAEMATPVLSQLLLRIKEMEGRMTQGALKFLSYQALRFKQFEQILRDPLCYVFERQQKVDDWSDRLYLALNNSITHKKVKLGQITLSPPRTKINFLKMQLDRWHERLEKEFTQRITNHQNYLLGLTKQLYALSYTKTLERGFCLAENTEGHIISRAALVPPNHPFFLRFSDGATTVQKLSKPSAQKDPAISAKKPFDPQSTLF